MIDSKNVFLLEAQSSNQTRGWMTKTVGTPQSALVSRTMENQSVTHYHSIYSSNTLAILNIDLILKHILSYLDLPTINSLCKSWLIDRFDLIVSELDSRSKENIYLSKNIIYEYAMMRKYKSSFHWSTIQAHGSRIVQTFLFFNANLIRECKDLISFLIQNQVQVKTPFHKSIKLGLFSSVDPCSLIKNTIFIKFGTYCEFQFLKEVYGDQIMDELQLAPEILIGIQIKNCQIDWGAFSQLLNLLKLHCRLISELYLKDSEIEITIVDLHNPPDFSFGWFNSLFSFIIQDGRICESRLKTYLKDMG